MANYIKKISSFVLILLTFLSINFSLAEQNIPKTDLDDYQKIYEELEEVDFEYIFGIDPNQADDYTKFMYSPYPLFRSGVNLIYKSKIIPPGYYLLTPREKDGKTYVLFKENGRVTFVIPVYEEDIVMEEFYEEKFPHPKLNPYQKTKKSAMNFIGTKWGHRNQRTPIPQAYIEFNDKGAYWDMILYYGLKKYCLLFKKDI